MAVAREQREKTPKLLNSLEIKENSKESRSQGVAGTKEQKLLNSLETEKILRSQGGKEWQWQGSKEKKLPNSFTP